MSYAKPTRGASLSANENEMGWVGTPSWVEYAGTSSLSVRRPTLIVSLLLTVQASWMNSPILLLWTLPSVMIPSLGYGALLRTS